MAYIYMISFDIPADQFHELNIGESVETSLAYLRALLPNEPGYITSRAMYTLNHTNFVSVLFESDWIDWDSLLHHRTHSRLNEEQLLREFRMRVQLDNLKTSVFEELG